MAFDYDVSLKHVNQNYLEYVMKTKCSKRVA